LDEYITSEQNPAIKHIRMLHRRKYRDMYDQYLVEGPKMVTEAFQGEENISYLAVSHKFPWREFKDTLDFDFSKTRILILDEGLFNDISDTKSPQGILAVVCKKTYALEDVLSRSSFFLVVLDQVRDPGNVGTIIRTLDAAQGDGIVLLKGCVEPYNPKTVRATMGSIFRVPIFQVTDYGSFFQLLLEQDVHILVSHLKGVDLFEWPGGFNKTALVIGNEIRGVQEDICNVASHLVKIPMEGGAESLNASVAAGILIYEVLRKRRG
jgi:TrmH family RNA methyltransferase